MLVPTDKPPPHPGEMLREDCLPELGWTAEDLARRLLVPVETIDDLLAERTGVTPEMALRLGRLFGQSPSFWLNLQLLYEIYLTEHSPAGRDILRIDPVREIRKAG